jgi:hypothetical protein
MPRGAKFKPEEIVTKRRDRAVRAGMRSLRDDGPSKIA